MRGRAALLRERAAAPATPRSPVARRPSHSSVDASLLALQGAVGNRVVARAVAHGSSPVVVARDPAAPATADQLTSARLSASERLQKAFRNDPAVRRKEQGDAVVRIQQTLLDAGIPLPISTAKTGLPDGHFGSETEGAVERFQLLRGLTQDGVVGHDTLAALDRAAGGAQPDTTAAGALAPGEETREWSVEEYAALWEQDHGRKMTVEERETLAKGCIGITALQLGRGDRNPPLKLSFSTFAQARAVAAELNRILGAKPALDELPDHIAASPELQGLARVLESFPIDPDPATWQAMVFSKRFYSNQAVSQEDRLDPNPDAFQPDPTTGQVDMSGYAYRGRPNPAEGPGAEFTNFDYGWFDEETDSWWHANNGEPDMTVYQSTLEYYSRPLLDFDRQVFTVAFARKP